MRMSVWSFWPQYARLNCKTPVMPGLLKSVAARRGVTEAQILSARRDHHIVRARWEFMASARAADLSYPQIGAFLHLHHTTVMHGVRNHHAAPQAVQEAA